MKISDRPKAEQRHPESVYARWWKECKLPSFGGTHKHTFTVKGHFQFSFYSYPNARLFLSVRYTYMSAKCVYVMKWQMMVARNGTLLSSIRTSFARCVSQFGIRQCWWWAGRWRQKQTRLNLMVTQWWCALCTFIIIILVWRVCICADM